MTSDDLSPDLCRGETGLSLSLCLVSPAPLSDISQIYWLPPSYSYTFSYNIALPSLAWVNNALHTHTCWVVALSLGGSQLHSVTTLL